VQQQISTPAGPVPISPAAGVGCRAGLYLTDEVFLYRVVDVQVSEPEEMVELEDCYGLDVVRVPLRAVRARRFRVVTPAPSAG
jgi:hypothetical protein